MRRISNSMGFTGVLYTHHLLYMNITCVKTSLKILRNIEKDWLYPSWFMYCLESEVIKTSSLVSFFDNLEKAIV